MEVQEALNKIQIEIRSLLKIDIEFRHIGSSALGLEGKKDIDLEVLVDPSDFKLADQKLTTKYGAHKKILDKFWKKFETTISEWEIDILLSTPEHEGTKQNKIFFEHLKNNTPAREDYLKIKNKTKHLPKEQYLKAKKDFFNKIIHQLCIEP